MDIEGIELFSYVEIQASYGTVGHVWMCISDAGKPDNILAWELSVFDCICTQMKDLI